MNDIVERLKPDPNQLDALESQARLASVMAQTPGPARRGRMLVVAGGTTAVLCAGVAVAINIADGGQASRDRDDSAERSLPESGEGECQPRLRIDGMVYLGAGYLEDSDAAVTLAGRGELSACNDEGGSGPQGAYFPAKPETAPVFTFGDRPADLVVGIEFASGYEVYVAESRSASRREEILKSLMAAK